LTIKCLTKCDRCGLERESSLGWLSYGEPFGESIDLCPACKYSFEEWMGFET